MNYKIVVRETDPQPMMAIRATCRAAEIGAILQEILPEVWRFLEAKKVKPAGPPFTRFFSYDDGVVDLEGGIPVEKTVDGEGRIAAGELPGGPAATTLHIGPYNTLPEAHDALHTWMHEHNKVSAGPQWEFYRTDPGREPDPSRWETELIWPIRDA